MSYTGNPYGQPSHGFQHRGATPDGQRGPPTSTNATNFDILEWHPAYESCQRYFLDHAQHEPGTKALCALINIRLPFQWSIDPIHAATPSQGNPHGTSQSYLFNPVLPSPSNAARHGQSDQTPPAFVSLIPYIRRLVVTGFDKSGILHGFFGDAWVAGISPLQECERRNYLFAAKHGGWGQCKLHYDGEGGEEVPFLKPLQDASAEELEAADKEWSSWLAMEDWMVGPRAPDDSDSIASNGHGGDLRGRGGQGPDGRN